MTLKSRASFSETVLSLREALFLALVSHLVRTNVAVATIDYTLKCVDFGLTGTGRHTNEVCAVTGLWYGVPYPLDNGTWVVPHDYGASFHYWIGLPEGLDVTLLNSLPNLERYDTGIDATVDIDEVGAPGNLSCVVTVTGIECQSCSVCAIEANTTVISADCRNRPRGRMVQCEPIYPVFLPLDFNTTEPTPAPVSLPPVEPSCSPSEMPTETPVEPRQYHGIPLPWPPDEDGNTSVLENLGGAVSPSSSASGSSPCPHAGTLSVIFLVWCVIGYSQ